MWADDLYQFLVRRLKTRNLTFLLNDALGKLLDFKKFFETKHKKDIIEIEDIKEIYERLDNLNKDIIHVFLLRI